MNKVSMREAPVRFPARVTGGTKELEGDTLGLFPYANALATFIKDCDTPMTIGIQGDWGSGKTTLLNMLRGEDGDPQSGILPYSRCRAVNFETWSYAQFNQDELLPLTCLYALARKVEDAVASDCKGADQAEPTKIAATARLLNVMKSVRVNSVSVAGIGVDLSGNKEDVEPASYGDLPEEMIKFRNSLQKTVTDWIGNDKRKRFVIFIDDLDRVKPIRALELLEAVKNFMDVEGCVFVLAVDYEIVQQGMIEKLGRDIQKTSGKSFFDKIIQLPFVMPSASYDMDGYLRDLLVGTGLPTIGGLLNSEDGTSFFREITLCTIGPNPRSIKRVASYVRLLSIIRNNQRDIEKFGRATQQDAKLLYALICMQVAWPELFGYFCKLPTSDTIHNLEDWEFLEALPEAQKLFERVHDVDATRNGISTFVDLIFELLDSNQDGTISSNEMAPVHAVLEISRLTNIKPEERPRDFIATMAIQQKAEKRLIDEIFKKSRWYTSTELEYRRSGNRYVTLVWNRRQLGTIVSLKKRPFVLRIAQRPEGLVTWIRETEPAWSDAPALTAAVRSIDDYESGLTGFGETVVDFAELTKLDNAMAVELLNLLFSSATHMVGRSQ